MHDFHGLVNSHQAITKFLEISAEAHVVRIIDGSNTKANRPRQWAKLLKPLTCCLTQRFYF